ncbi:hypothetical protein AB0B66_34375 [Catellatospora sp. NPDC049111]|uniref:hypothetical protein n=1 Tax=Catellatospora sp. NPDC049111 TaxID=3155271 RepID=UPI0033EE0B3D
MSASTELSNLNGKRSQLAKASTAHLIEVEAMYPPHPWDDPHMARPAHEPPPQQPLDWISAREAERAGRNYQEYQAQITAEMQRMQYEAWRASVPPSNVESSAALLATPSTDVRPLIEVADYVTPVVPRVRVPARAHGSGAANHNSYGKKSISSETFMVLALFIFVVACALGAAIAFAAAWLLDM